MKNSTCQFVFALLITALFAACSRPVAYVQKSQRETFATTVAPTPAAAVFSEAALPAFDVTTPAAEAMASATPATTLDQVDALVRNDRRLATDKTIQKRLSRVRSLLAAPAVASAPTGKVHRTSMMERVMTKKIDRQITKKFSPQKPALNSGTLATGAVLVIVGLLLMLLTTGTAATIGLIALVIGVIALLLGLL